MATANDGAAAVQALKQSAQQVAAAPGSGAGELYAQAGSPGGAAPQMTAQQEIMNRLAAGMQWNADPANYADPGDANPRNDAMTLAVKQARQQFQETGTPTNAMEILFNDPMKYMNMGIEQRWAYQGNDVDTLTDMSQSGDPLLDVIVNWELYPYSYGYQGGADGGSSGASGPGSGAGSGGDGGGPGGV